MKTELRVELEAMLFKAASLRPGDYPFFNYDWHVSKSFHDGPLVQMFIWEGVTGAMDFGTDNPIPMVLGYPVVVHEDDGEYIRFAPRVQVTAQPLAPPPHPC